jgi:hypothetical protein
MPAPWVRNEVIVTELAVVDCVSTSKHEKGIEIKTLACWPLNKRKEGSEGLIMFRRGWAVVFYVASPRTPFRFPFDDDANAVMPEELILVER